MEAIIMKLEINNLCSVPDFALRLVNSSNPCEGRIEVYYNRTWGTVCDDDWDINDAQVVCREIGCGDAISALGDAYFGEGNGNVWLSNLQCKGTESHLWQCKHLGWGVHGCHTVEDAGIICAGEFLVFMAPVFKLMFPLFPLFLAQRAKL